MNNAQTLKALTPTVLQDGIVDGINAIEGAALDRAEAAADQLLQEVLPDLAWITLPEWERIMGIATNPELSLVERRRNVLVRYYGRKLRKEFFVRLAALMGQTITVTDYVRPRCGRARCGNALLCVEEAKWQWVVRGLVDTDELARAGELCAGERLGGSSANIETIFNKLKPAHTQVFYEYVA